MPGLDGDVVVGDVRLSKLIPDVERGRTDALPELDGASVGRTKAVGRDEVTLVADTAATHCRDDAPLEECGRDNDERLKFLTKPRPRLDGAAGVPSL